MAMTKKTVYTTTHVATDEEQNQVNDKAAQLIADGATDGFYRFQADPTTGIITRIRHWVDQDAAVSWQSWLNTFAVDHGFSWNSFEISDI